MIKTTILRNVAIAIACFAAIISFAAPDVVVAQSRTEKQWPTEVYSPYNIPAFTNGELLYAPLRNTEGNAYFRTTPTAVAAYIEQLQALGFRIKVFREDLLLPALKTKENPANPETPVHFFLPPPGRGVYVEIYFDFFTRYGDETTRGKKLSAGNRSIQWNLHISLKKVTPRKYQIVANTLTEIGISDAARIPREAKESRMKVADSNRLAGIITVDDFCFDYDYEVTPEVFHEWTEKLLAACRASADDGAVHDMKGNGDSPTYYEAIASYFWQYRYKGITYDFRTQLISKGFRGVMNLYVTVPTKKK